MTLSRDVECLGRGHCRRMSSVLVGALSRDVKCLGRGHCRGMSSVLVGDIVEGCRVSW